jgi:2,5-diamino-6-(ribosylamino)-4(3H)-pyrimidinone 5'-phosphate reductase
MQRYFDKTIDVAPPGQVDRDEVYRRLALPRGVDQPVRRPYMAINVVTTVDGKIVVGGPGTTRLIGSPTDHALMSQIELQADAVLMGAGVAREDDPPYPRLPADRQRQRDAMGLRPQPLWAIVSGTGQFPRIPQVLRDGGPSNTALFTTDRVSPGRREELGRLARVYVCGRDQVDVLQMGAILRDELGVGSMICIGGGILNATLVEAGAADELFVTLSPKLQGGSRMSTLMEGRGFPPADLPVLDLLSLYGDGNELYLRYRLPRPGVWYNQGPSGA